MFRKRDSPVEEMLEGQPPCGSRQAQRLPNDSQSHLRLRHYLAMRERDRDDFVFVLPDHVLLVDRDAPKTGVAAGLLGSRAEDRLNLIERHARFDFDVIVLGDRITAAANKKKKARQQQQAFDL